MIKHTLIIFALCASFFAYSQDTSRVSFLFIGDVMGHDRQLEAAYNPVSGEYEFDTCFSYMSSVFSNYDFAIANLEVTLNCKPFKGYPSFSSPPALAQAAVDAGVNVFVTSNNHAADRGYKGVVNTVATLNEMGVKHTGVFANNSSRSTDYPLVLEKNGVRVALLNYTYGLNGNAVPNGTVINLIDSTQLLQDLTEAKTLGVDKIIVFTHWGKEYEHLPNYYQKAIADFLFKNGADIIIGSHPHVVQPAYYDDSLKYGKETFIVYSLGNFISNQRTQPRDGGQMISLELVKVGNKVFIENQGYILTWVYAPFVEGEKDFLVLPASKYETNTQFFNQTGAFEKMQACLLQNRSVLQKENVNVPEIKITP